MEENDDTKKSKVQTPKGAWVVMACVFIAGIALAFAQYKVTPVLPQIMTDLSVDRTMGGWILSIFTLIGIFLAFPAVAVIKKWGIKIGGLASLVFALIGGIIGFFADGQTALIASRVIEGFGLGLIGVIAPSAISMWFPIAKRGAPMGLWSSWQMVGISVSFFFGLPIANAFGDWKGLWIVSVIILVVALVLYAIFVKPPKEGENFANIEDGGVSIFGVLKHKDPWLMAVAGFAFGIANSVVIAWVATYWELEGGLSQAVANNFTGWMFFLEIFGCIIFGLVLNKIRKRRWFIVIDSVLYAIVFFFIFRVNFFSGIIAMLILYAVIESGFCAAMWTLVSQSVPDPRLGPGAIALFTIAVDIGMMLGSPLGGFFIDNFGWGALSLLVCIAQLIAALAYGVLKLYNEKGEVVKI